MRNSVSAVSSRFELRALKIDRLENNLLFACKELQKLLNAGDEDLHEALLSLADWFAPPGAAAVYSAAEPAEFPDGPMLEETT